MTAHCEQANRKCSRGLLHKCTVCNNFECKAVKHNQKNASYPYRSQNNDRFANKLSYNSNHNKNSSYQNKSFPSRTSANVANVDLDV